jgi:hypothetical protein
MKASTKLIWVKRKTIIAILCLLVSGTMAQIGVHTDTPDPSSAMDIVASDRGLLIPRVTLTSALSDPSPVSSPATGLLVFNEGANQPVGFYYWNGAQWTAVAGSGGSGGDYWALTGNSGTAPGTNFIGTTDNVDLIISSNNLERIRVENDGQVIVGSSAPNNVADLFTVIGNVDQDYAVAAYSSNVGFYTESDYAGVYNSGGQFGVLSLITYGLGGYAGYFKNYDPDGYGLTAVGSNQGAIAVGNRSFGITASGDEGIFAVGYGTTGIGVIGNGGGQTGAPQNTTGWGGAFKGYHGGINRGMDANGIGVVGVGNALATWQSLPEGSGGAFTGYHGLNAKAINAAEGTGVVGIGNNEPTFSLLGEGSGGAFVGYHGLFAQGKNTSGHGIFGIGNNIISYTFLTAGCGGSFNGYHGIYAHARNATEGTGIIALGSDESSYQVLTEGSGGSFTGYHGLIATARNTTDGTGVVASGNNVAYFTYDNGTGGLGSGGAFTGQWCGVAGYGTEQDAATVGVYGEYSGNDNSNGIGVYGKAVTTHPGRGIGVYGEGNDYGVYANGDVGASGAKPFVIDHPLDPENKILKHFAMESPEVLNMYRGNVILDDIGSAQIVLPEYFHAININFSYNLTAIGNPAPGLHISREIDYDGAFSIAGGNPGQKISWVVYAERNDPYMQVYRSKQQPEMEKPDAEKGKYIRPELYNQPPEMGIHYTKGGKAGQSRRSSVNTQQVVEKNTVSNEIIEDEPVIIKDVIKK